MTAPTAGLTAEPTADLAADTAADTTSLPVAPPVARPVRYRLGNGLRLVALHDPGSRAVGVAVAYGVGYRSETRSGFAHLFEHMMFQGGARLPAQAHARLVQSRGGAFNGTTYRDHTAYYQALPAEETELGLFLEADRMAAPALTAEKLARQVEVIGEEIRRTVHNRPYGGFPTFQLPAAAFDRFANSHDGFGDTASLGEATVEDCAAFFDTHYAPGNAVLAVCGPVPPERVAELAERHFGPIAARPVPPRPDLSEPAWTADRTVERTDRLAPVPALALGWRLPPAGGRAHLAAVLLAGLLGDADAGRLRRRLVRERRMAGQAIAMAGLTGPFESADPDLFLVNAVCTPGVPVAAVEEAAAEELSALAADGPDEQELRRAVRKLSAAWYRDTDSAGSRARRLAGYELLHDDAALVAEAPDRLASVTAEEVRAVADTMVRGHRTSLHLLPATES
ncbi:pitrilysin family protein [Kitasatospora sp. NPDC086791]|uniref:M16 family metallopeptidase n=1 Tax=Kitasatospora sp. NPDC086791 TaxID=3155178 RepID=UPI00341ECDB9